MRIPKPLKCPPPGEDILRRQHALGEIRRLLVKRSLLDEDEELDENMLDDLVHFAYFTGCIPKAKVREFLGLTESEAKDRIRLWKKWQEGNKHCQVRQNPFYEGWQKQGDD